MPPPGLYATFPRFRKRPRATPRTQLLSFPCCCAAGVAAAMVLGLAELSRRSWVYDRRDTSLVQSNAGLNAKKAAAAAQERAQLSPPHVIYIMIDDLGWNDIGYQSTDLFEVTPVLDSLASRGVKLTNYYSMYLCSPARASLMTGRYAFRYGLQYNMIEQFSPAGLPLSERVMPQYFKDAGYATHMVGKWHLGLYSEEFLPSNRGFDTFLGFLGGGEDYWTHISDGYFDFGFGDKDGYVDKKTGLPRLGPSYVGQYSTTIFADRAVEVIHEHSSSMEAAAASGQKQAQQPLFFYFSAQAVHPFVTDPDNAAFSVQQQEMFARVEAGSKEPAPRVNFAKTLMSLDMAVGRVISALEETGLMDNALIVVTSDNGGCPYSGGANYPLRGHKHTYFEGGNRVPGFVYSPALLPRASWGSEYSGLMHVTDWLPTFGGLAGLQLDPGVLLDGVDQWAGITGATTATEDKEEAAGPAPVGKKLSSASYGPRSELVYNSDQYALGASSLDLVILPPSGAIRVGNWKLIVQEVCAGYYSFSYNDSYNEGMCSDVGYCASCTYGCDDRSMRPSMYLFDLDADPIEQINRIDTNPDVARQLYDRFSNYSAAAVPTVERSEMPAAAAIWDHHARWMVPWWDAFMNHEVEGADSVAAGTEADGGPKDHQVVPRVAKH